MNFHQPVTVQDAVALAHASTGTTRFLAGGTDVLVQLRGDLVTPDCLIDIKAIPGAKSIGRDAKGGWKIGMAVTGAELNEHAEFCRDWPGIAEAVGLIGSTQVQGRATLTGNLCNASPAADSVPAMIAAGATATIAGPDGEREVLVGDIPTGPGKTCLAKGELIVAFHLPPRAAQSADAYLRFIPRTEMDIAVAGAAVNLRLDGERVAEARVAIGAVAPTAHLVPGAGEALVGTTLDDAALASMVAAVRDASQPIDDKRGTAEFRRQVVGVIAARAARIAYDRAKGVL